MRASSQNIHELSSQQLSGYGFPNPNYFEGPARADLSEILLYSYADLQNSDVDGVLHASEHPAGSYQNGRTHPLECKDESTATYGWLTGFQCCWCCCGWITSLLWSRTAGEPPRSAISYQPYQPYQQHWNPVNQPYAAVDSSLHQVGGYLMVRLVHQTKVMWTRKSISTKKDFLLQTFIRRSKSNSSSSRHYIINRALTTDQPMVQMGYFLDTRTRPVHQAKAMSIRKSMRIEGEKQWETGSAVLGTFSNVELETISPIQTDLNKNERNF